MDRQLSSAIRAVDGEVPERCTAHSIHSTGLGGVAVNFGAWQAVVEPDLSSFLQHLWAFWVENKCSVS